MTTPPPEEQSPLESGIVHPPTNARMSIPEIARRLEIGRVAVYSMLKAGLLPGIWIGHRWIVTRYAYEQWERTCGMQTCGAVSPRETRIQ